MKPSDFNSQLESYIKTVDTALDSYLTVKDNPQKNIYTAMRYSVFAGGKRLRPVLMLACNKMCSDTKTENGDSKNTSGEVSDALPFACAMELIHTYSLIHDDLPAMDNDYLRRGMPTSHIKFGEAIAILAGDALLNKAFEIMLTADINSDKAIKIMSVIAKSSGTEGMIGGQVADIGSEDSDIDIAALRYLHSLKTGAIIRSACVAGAIAAEASAEEISAVDDFAKNLGIAFQIRDDILDVTGDEKELGKNIGSDSEQNKNTYASILGLEKSAELVEKYSSDAKKSLDIFGERADFLLTLTDYLVNRDK